MCPFSGPTTRAVRTLPVPVSSDAVIVRADREVGGGGAAEDEGGARDGRESRDRQGDRGRARACRVRRRDPRPHRARRRGARAQLDASKRSDTSPLPGSLDATADLVRAEAGTASPCKADLLDHVSLVHAVAAVLADVGSRRRARQQRSVRRARAHGPHRSTRRFQCCATTSKRTRSHPSCSIKEVVPQMIERGGGTIINITSSAAYEDPPAPAGRRRLGTRLRVQQGGAASHRRRARGRAARPRHPGVQRAARLHRDRTHPPGHGRVRLRRVDRCARRGRRQGVPLAARVARRRSRSTARCIQAQQLCSELGLLPGWSLAVVTDVRSRRHATSCSTRPRVSSPNVASTRCRLAEIVRTAGQRNIVRAALPLRQPRRGARRAARTPRPRHPARRARTARARRRARHDDAAAGGRSDRAAGDRVRAARLARTRVPAIRQRARRSNSIASRPRSRRCCDETSGLRGMGSPAQRGVATVPKKIWNERHDDLHRVHRTRRGRSSRPARPRRRASGAVRRPLRRQPRRHADRRDVGAGDRSLARAR